MGISNADAQRNSLEVEILRFSDEIFNFQAMSLSFTTYLKFAILDFWSLSKRCSLNFLSFNIATRSNDGSDDFLS